MEAPAHDVLGRSLLVIVLIAIDLGSVIKVDACVGRFSTDVPDVSLPKALPEALHQQEHRCACVLKEAGLPANSCSCSNVQQQVRVADIACCMEQAEAHALFSSRRRLSLVVKYSMEMHGCEGSPRTDTRGHSWHIQFSLALGSLIRVCGRICGRSTQHWGALAHR